MIKIKIKKRKIKIELEKKKKNKTAIFLTQRSKAYFLTGKQKRNGHIHTQHSFELLFDFSYFFTVTRAEVLMSVCRVGSHRDHLFRASQGDVYGLIPSDPIQTHRPSRKHLQYQVGFYGSLF